MSKKRRIAKAVIFLAVLAAIHAGLRQAYYAFITPQDSYLRRQQEFTAHLGPYDIALFGDSHALISVQPGILGSAANLSQLGEGYVERYYKFHYNLRKNPGKIKTIILPLDLHSFSPAWGENFNVVSSSRYVNFPDYLWHGGLSSQAVRNVFHYYVFPYADCTPAIYEALPSRKQETMNQNIARLGRSLADTPASMEQIKRLFNEHYGEDREWFSEKALFYFNRIKALCHKEGIRVVFVRFPVSEQYVDAASRFIPLEEFDALTQELVSDWPGAVLLDYRSLYFGRDDLFTDLNHLNVEGSTLFSQRLRGDLAQLGVLSSGFETPVH